ncbi:MAG: hypothetical protein FWD65_05610 [Coriobacteriia bacterium]|nr:hypothetical protein [Coriobacteriia bacterium]
MITVRRNKYFAFAQSNALVLALWCLQAVIGAVAYVLSKSPNLVVFSNQLLLDFPMGESLSRFA